MPESPSPIAGERAPPLRRAGRGPQSAPDTWPLGDAFDADESHEHDKAHDQQDPDGKHS